MGSLSPAADPPAAIVAETRVSAGIISIPTGVATIVAFTTEDADDLAAWVIGSPTIFTVPTTGEYVFGAWWLWAADPAPIVRREGQLEVNGVYVIGHESSMATGLDGSCEAFRRLTAGDTIRLSVFQNTGAALDLTTSAMWLVRVS